MANWTRRWWKPIWIPYGSSFQKACAEEWELEMHTSDDPIWECGYHWQDTSTWFRRAHELSEKEMFACLTRADSCDESNSPCEPEIAPKPLDFDCVLHDAHKPTGNGLHTPYESPSAPPKLPSTPAVFLAASSEYKYGAGLLGTPWAYLQTSRPSSSEASCSRTTGGASTVEASNT